MRFELEPKNPELQELERQKKSQRRINTLLIVINLVLLGLVIYELIVKISKF